MGTSAGEVIGLARKQLGIGESPADSNRNKFTAWYGVATPWCAIFVSWLFETVGAEGLVKKAAWCPDQARWFQDRNRWGKKPKKGAIVYFDWRNPGSSGFNHVGIVEAVRSNGTFVTIEGNWSNAVRRVVRDMRHVKGFGYPMYSGSKPIPAPSLGGRVSLSALVKAAKSDPDRPQGGTTPGAVEDVKIVEKALKHEGLLPSTYAKDGSFGSLTVEAYAKWQRQCGYSGKDADGIPGESSLKRLADRYGFRVVD
jgi:CHAP domain